MKPRHIFVPAIAAVVLFAGCSSDTETQSGGNPTDPNGAGAPGECAAPGEASDAVEVSGDFGGPLELVSDLPVTATELQRTVLTEGDGEAIEDGQEVIATITLFSGTTGETIGVDRDVTVENSDGVLLDWAHQAVRCAAVGERTAVALPASEAFGENAAQVGYDADDTTIVVVDITDIAPTPPGTLSDDELLLKAEGTAVEAPEGFPTVVLDDDGMPEITIPDTEPPTELSVATLIEGDGEEVQQGDRVYVHYRGVIWRTGEEFDSSWSRGSHTDFLTTEVIGGFSEALVGQTVGSQVISVVPAPTEQGGYGGDRLAQMGHEEDDVMVFVLDILGTAHAG